MSVCALCAGALRSPGLELEVFMSYPLWVTGAEFRCSPRERRAISTLNHWAMSSTPPYNLVTSLAIQSPISFTPIECLEFSRIMQKVNYNVVLSLIVYLTYASVI